MLDIRQWYRNRILGNIPAILGHWDDRRGIFAREAGKEAHYRHCLRPLAWFYKHEPEENPFFGDASILDKIVRAGDHICRAHDDEDGAAMLGTEWIPYNLVECLDWLGDELGEDRRRLWTDAVAAHCDAMKQINCYVACAPNHQMWRAALLARAGQLFDNPAWRDSGRMLARQICKVQTPDGYWDESRRTQGPSPNYHRTHLAGLDLYYRITSDEQVRQPLLRAVEFAVRAAWPDGTPIETFDSRQPYLAAFAAAMGGNAISRTPQGRRLLRLQAQRLDELGVTRADAATGFAVNWYLFATTDFILDSYRFCEPGPDAPLPQESDGHRDTLQLNGPGVGGVGAGVLARQAGWTIALSAAQTDLPRATNHIYNTERQSGISVYHRQAGLIVGGGNRMRNHIPLANAHVLTGWKGVDCHAGRFADADVVNHGLPIRPDGTSTETNDPVKACYYPISRTAAFTDRGGHLTLEFMHASIRFEVEAIDAGRLQIRYAFEAADAKKILLQTPVPLFFPGRFAIDGGQFAVGPDLEDIQTVAAESVVELDARGCQVRYVVHCDGPTWFTWPLEPIKNWAFADFNYVPDVQYQPLYCVGLLSSEFAGQSSGQGVLLEIEVAGRGG